MPSRAPSFGHPWINKCEYDFAYRHSLLRADFDHPPEEVLALGRNKMWDMEYSPLHFLQQLPKIIIVKRKSTLQK